MLNQKLSSTLSMGRCYNQVNGRVEFEAGWLKISSLMNESSQMTKTQASQKYICLLKDCELNWIRFVNLFSVQVSLNKWSYGAIVWVTVSGLMATFCLGPFTMKRTTYATLNAYDTHFNYFFSRLCLNKNCSR
jgi:hypothetical protein